MLGLELGVTAARHILNPALAPHKPTLAQLFTAGHTAQTRTGGLYDPSVTGSLFQDAAGTIPVTAVGQPVGRMRDLSGLGHDAVQSDPAGRPTYGSDGTHHWLTFDGIANRMEISFGGNTSEVLSAGVSLRKLGTNRGTILNGTNAPRMTLEGPSLVGGDYMSFLWTDLATNTSLRHVAAGSSADVIVMTGDMTDRSLTMTVNDGTPQTNFAATGSGDLMPDNFLIGCRDNSLFYFEGRLFGLVLVSDHLSGAERSLVQDVLSENLV